MPNGPVLELSTLRERQPHLHLALVPLYVPATIFRLCYDPTPQPPGTLDREVVVNWIRRVGGATATEERRRIGWANFPQFDEALFLQLPLTVPEDDLTEQAAIGLMALLLSDLEQGVLQCVLQPGSGADYLVGIEGWTAPIPIEVSGVRVDESGDLSRQRRWKKEHQVLGQSRVGFVSVTTFSYRASAGVHSYLHYVKGKRGKKGRRKR